MGRRGPNHRQETEGARRDLGLGVELVYEDEDVLVIDKPAGLLTASEVKDGRAPDPDEKSVFAVVKRYIREKRKRRGTRVWIVHRLDKESSGLLVFALNEKAFAWLKEDFRARRTHRIYVAVAEGEMHSPEGGLASGTVKSFLDEGPDGLMRSVEPGRRGTRTTGVSRGPEDRGPQLAVTHYRAAAVGNGLTLLQLRLATGRKNQIRVHLRDLKHPLVGDRRYGAATDPLGRLCLHAMELGFTNPATGQAQRFMSPTPDAFYRMVGTHPPRKAEPAPAFGGQSAAEAAPDAAPSTRRTKEAAKDRGWDHVAEWYDRLIDERESDHYQRVILPGALRLLGAKRGQRVLDVACGQGVLAKQLATQGVAVTGVDASPRLIEIASRTSAGLDPAPTFKVADAREIEKIGGGPYDGAACVMALMNIEPLDPLLRGVASLLAPGGAFVAVMLHPAFRSPGQTSWGWDESSAAKGRRSEHAGALQYRRVDGYLSPGQREIIMNPGAASRGEKPILTFTYHRPLQAYIAAFAAAGLLVEMLEEWPSMRTSEPGPRAAEENRARREIPLFLGVRAIKRT